MQILIVGCGYVGLAVARLFFEDGHRVVGLRRDPSRLPDWVEPLAIDVGAPFTISGEFDHILYMVSPGESSDAGYHAAYVEGVGNLLAASRPRQRLWLLSTTAVYGQDEGQWVDEASAAEPARAQARHVLEGERLVQQSGVPATVLRAAGIYGPERTRLLANVNRGELTAANATTRYTNRIHRQDLARAFVHLTRLARPRSLYLAVDREPVEQRLLVAWLARELAAHPGARAQLAATNRIAAPRPTAQGSREVTNKRCSSERLQATGFQFLYPSFREGYAQILRELSPARE